MMGSRSIYHEGWKATTNHISTGVLDEEELAVGSRDFDEDRWELFDLSSDFSEAIDRADDEPERLRQLRDLWDAEARAQQRAAHLRRPGRPLRRLHPAGLAGRAVADVPPRRRPGGRRVGPAPLGRLRHHGRHRHRPGRCGRRRLRPGRLVRRLRALPGRRAGPLHLRPGRRRARAGDCPARSAPGRHELTVLLRRRRRDGAPGRMVLLVDGAEVDETAVEGMLPHGAPARRGGTAARLGQRVPGVLALRAAGSLRRARCTRSGSDTPGSLGPIRPTRCAPRCTPTERGRRAGVPSGSRPTAARPGVGQVLAGVAGRHRRQVDRRKDPTPGRSERRRPVELLVARAPAAAPRVAPRCPRAARPSRPRSDGRRPHGVGRVGPVDLARRCRSRRRRRPSHRSQRALLRVALGDVVEDHADRPFLARHRPRPLASSGHDCGRRRPPRRSPPRSRRPAPPPAHSASGNARQLAQLLDRPRPRRRHPPRRPGTARRCRSAFTGSRHAVEARPAARSPR